MRTYVKILVVPVIFLLACTDSTDPINIDPVSLEEAQDASIDFALKMLYNLASDTELQDENLIISPLSIQAALYMTLNGAEGNTESQMAGTLSFGDIIPDSHNQAFKDLVTYIMQGNETSQLNLSNAVFYDDAELSLNNTFRDNLEEHYEARFESADFKDEETVDLINDWVKESTENRIEKIIETIDPSEIMFLINALTFQGDWLKGFPEYGTIDRIFTTSRGEQIQTEVMSSDDFRPYHSNFDYEAVDFPLKDSLFAMTFIKPQLSGSGANFINNFSSLEKFSIFYRSMISSLNDEKRVFVNLPKFESGSKLKLKQVLQNMGMEDAFNMGKADFSDFGSANGNLYLNRVLHDTYLKVDEKGLEGAAVTAVGVSVTSVPPVINFDRPFLFILRHIETKAIIFAGYINNPKE